MQCAMASFSTIPAKDAVPTRKDWQVQHIIPNREQFRLLVATIRQADVRGIQRGNLV